MDKNPHLEQWLHDVAHEDCQQSFGQLYDHFYPKLFGLARYYLKSNQIAEEVINDVFVKIWHQRKRLPEVLDIQRYLNTAVKRQSLNALREKRHNHLYIDSLEYDIVVEHGNPERKMVSDQFLDYFASCIKNLPESQRLVFRLIKEDGMKYREVAELLDLSQKTVEMHITSAMKKLRQDVGAYHRGEQGPGVVAIVKAIALLLAFFVC